MDLSGTNFGSVSHLGLIVVVRSQVVNLFANWSGGGFNRRFFYGWPDEVARGADFFMRFGGSPGGFGPPG
jgi:hypothetical protein